MESWRSGRTAQIVWVTVAMLGGVLVGRRWIEHCQLLVLGWAVFTLLFLRLRLGLLVILVLVGGIWRGEATAFEHTLLAQNLGNTVTIIGAIGDDPGPTVSGSQIGFKLNNAALNGRKAGQSVQVYTPYKSLQRGYRVMVTGKLKPRRGSTPVQVSFAQVAVLSDHISLLEKLRQRFFAAVRVAMPEPMSGFGLGLLIGVRSLIDKDLQDVLTAVGLSHLIAVSGYNLTIIIQATRRLSSFLSAFSMTVFSLWLIAGFLVVTGFSAPIVRAAVVSGLGLLIAYYGYQVRPLVIIAVPAAITVAWNPDYLVRDISWQLSFLAFTGVLILGPLMEQRWVRRPNAIKSLFIESTAAQLTTAPLILGLFTNLSLVSPLSNVLILPLVPLAMLLSFTAGLAAMISPLLGAWFALPTTGLLALMIGLSQWFATWPHANINLATSTREVLGLYGLVLLLTFSLWRWEQCNLDKLEKKEYSPFDRKLG